MTDSHPRHRYRVGLDAHVLFPTLAKLPTFWTDSAYLLSTMELPLPAAVKARRNKAT